jgi:hypothetical protein
MVSEKWDEAVRGYVSELHERFEPPRLIKQPRPGYVYFIRFGDRVKIGYTTDFARRRTELPHDAVLGVIPGTLDDEAAWHRLFADLRIKGEWFHADRELLAAIERVTASTG